MKLHIQRWHKEGEPLTVSLLKGKKNQYSGDSVSKSVGSRPFPFHESFSKGLESFPEFVNNTHRWVVEAMEIRRKVEEIKMFSNSNPSYFIQLPNNNNSGSITPAIFGKSIVPSISLPPFYANPLYPSSTFVPPSLNSQETRREEITGYRAKICEKCMEIVIETQYVDERGTSLEVVGRNGHTCSLTEGRSETTLQNAVRRILNASVNLEQLPWELMKAVKGWTGQNGQNSAYLVAFKLPIDKVKVDTIIDINVLPSGDKMFKGSSNSLNNSIPYGDQDNNNDKGTHKWALQAIESGQIILNDNDILDFLMIAGNRTYGYFRVHVNANNLEDRSYRNSEVYCMFINKGLLIRKEMIDNSKEPNACN
ncbi:MAG TPA: hypothetical protein VFS97_13920 [Nitrososphaeraceae archaeon]|nr:hypothetical protein [Nitrososphaeraceae archaeon]